MHCSTQNLPRRLVRLASKKFWLPSLLAKVAREVFSAERAAVIGLRDQGRIDDETLRLVERERDLEEQRLH